MRLLSRYVRRHFLGYFCGGLAACAGLLLLVEVFDRIDDVYWTSGAVDRCRTLFGLKLPWMVYQMMPAACLLASVVTFSTLNKHHETVAIRAHGISPLRLTRPLFVVGGVVCLVLLMAQEYLLPYTNQAYNLSGEPAFKASRPIRVWGYLRRVRSGTAAPSVSGVPNSACRLSSACWVSLSTILDAQGVIRERYDAAEARHDGQGWLLLQGTRRTFNTAGMFAGLPETFTEYRVAFPERPEEISALRKAPEEMSLRETLAYAHALRRQGVADPIYLVEFHGKLAYAVLCIIMAGFGMPLALHMNRNGGPPLPLA